jgi:chromosome partitioning protein
MQIRIAVANHKGGSGKTSTTMLVAANLGSDLYKVAVVDLDPQGSATLWAQASEGRFPAHVVPAKGDTLANVLKGLKDFDAVLMDCPPSSTAPETLAALQVATLVVIPCGPSPLDYWATDALCNVADLRVPDVPRLVVVNQAANTTLARDMAGHIEKTWPTARARLGSRTVYREAAALGLGLRQLPGRANRDAIAELDALSLEILTTAMKAA